MKHCARCGLTKAPANFYRSVRRADGLQVYCAACCAEISHQQYERRVGRSVARRARSSYETPRSAWLRSLKTGRPCTDCGRIFAPQVMQWDHLPQFKKVGDISEAFRGRTEQEVLIEIAKCELVCTNCHTIRTFRRNGWRMGRSVQEAEAPYRIQWTLVAA